MSNVSKELNSILNDNKDFETKEKSPALFITLIIFFVAAVYFAVLYMNTMKKLDLEKNKIEKLEYKKNTKAENSNYPINKEIITTKKIEGLIKPKEITKEKIITITKIDKKNFREIYYSDKFKTFKCYDYEGANFTPSKFCKKSLINFAKNNKEALRFQVISVISNKDINSYTNFKQATQDLLLNGLSIKRISEITWDVKRVLGNDIIITSNNYYVKSKENNSGIILKAYY